MNVRPGDVVFPRVIKRGLIEATAWPLAKRWRTRLFPRVIKRGLIEALLAMLVPKRGRSFPRVIKRGLIEAGGVQPFALHGC